MGIPGFYGRWLTRNVRRAILKGLPQYVATLAFDLNGAIHAARKKVFGEDNEMEKIKNDKVFFNGFVSAKLGEITEQKEPLNNMSFRKFNIVCTSEAMSL